ncbi:MAG TPA: oligosaccharide flippase family protein [Candidatus Eisenbacteria bacterium]|nr:oligosaccharide flippase family protein [Candidatus Eisenbacteria bacterium]
MTSLRRNAIANVLGRSVTAALWVVATPFVLDRLGAERFGIWALFFAFSGYLTTFNLGIGNTMIRFIAAERASEDRLAVRRTLGRGLWLAGALGVFWALAVVVARSGIAGAFRVPAPLVPETLQALLIFSLGVLLTFPIQVLAGSLQGFERLDLSNLCMVLGVAVHIVALYLGLTVGGGLREVALAGVLGQAVSGLLSALLVVVLVRRVRPGTGRPGPKWRELLHFGAALQMTNILSVLQLQVGKIMLGLLGTLAMVADYELAFRVASGVAGIPYLILAALIPTVSRVWKSDGPQAVTSLFTTSLRWLYTHTTITLGMLWLLAPDITRVWLGPKHDHVAVFIRLWAISYAADLAWSPATAVARGMGKPWIEVGSLIATVIMNAALGYWWVPLYGTSGAIAAMACSYSAGFVTYLAVSRRFGVTFGPWIRRELLPRAAVAWLAVALCTLALASGPLAVRFPSPGWAHGALTAALYLSVFALFFLPFGDTQRMSRAVWHLVAGLTPRGREVASS